MTDDKIIKNFLINGLWRNRENRTWWLAGLGVIMLEFLTFKLYYPYANYTGDSYYYLKAAASNSDVSIWPVAYSKFLRLVSVFTHSDTLVVGAQYLLLQISTLLFLFSLFYWIQPGVWIKRVLLLFIIINPVSLYIANYIGSDALFISLSFLWLTSLLWLIYHPGMVALIGQGILLLGCFVVRYNAIYYPGITLIAFLLSPLASKFKISGLAFSSLLLLVSVWFTSNKMEEVTGKRQFSAFSGWQLANNALYMYEHIPAGRRGTMPGRFIGLERMVREHMDTLAKVKLTQHDVIWMNFYLWDDRGPLVQYQNREYKNDKGVPEFKKWASEGPLYQEYAIYLIREYPFEYIKRFMAPNALKFFTPPREFLGMYNMGLDSVAKIARDWFQYKSLRIADHNNINHPIRGINWYPIFSALVNVLFLLGAIGVLVMGLVNKDTSLYKLLMLLATLWMLNFGFSVFSAPIVLRYQLFPVIVCLSGGLVFADRLWKMA